MIGYKIQFDYEFEFDTNLIFDCVIANNVEVTVPWQAQFFVSF